MLIMYAKGYYCNEGLLCECVLQVSRASLVLGPAAKLCASPAAVNKVKSIMIFVDGGPDENPRYEKPLQAAIHHFVKFNLDAIFVSCFAPHQSAYNPVER